MNSSEDRPPPLPLPPVSSDPLLGPSPPPRRFGVPMPPPMDESFWRFVFQDGEDEEEQEKAEQQPDPPTA